MPPFAPDPLPYGSYARPVRLDLWQYIVGVHWGKAPLTQTPPVAPGIHAIVQPIFSGFESDFGGAWTLIVNNQFASQFVQLPIVYFPGNSSYSINGGGHYDISLICTYMSADPPSGVTPCQCAILDGHTFLPLATSPVTAGPNDCSIPYASIPASGVYVVPAFRVVGMGTPSMAAVGTWTADYY
jgi:hypothetical protein